MKNIYKIIIYCFVFIFAVIYFYGVINQKPFSDDWMLLEIGRELHGKPLMEWLTVKDHFNVWRPLPYIFKGLYLNGNNRDLMFYNSFKSLLLILTIILTYLTAKAITRDKTVALLSCLFFFLNPTTIGAVQNVDHIFKITGTLFFAISILFLYRYFENQRALDLSFFMLFFASGFFSDADALGIFPAVFIILIYNLKKLTVKKSIIIVGTSIIIVLVYFYLRGIVIGSVLGGGVSGKQEIVLNYNIIINAGKLFLSSFIFTISPYVFFKKTVFILIAGLFMLINLAMIIFAYLKSKTEQKKILLLLSGLSFAAMIPFILVRHVSEIYSLRPSYLLMIIFAYSVFLIYGGSKRIGKRFIQTYVVILLLSGAISLIIKQDMMLERGLMAEHMAQSMKSILPNPPKFAKINIILDDCGVTETYSDFINNDIQLADLGKKYNDFIRYNYNNSTLNSASDSKDLYNLTWDCSKKEFILQN